MIINIATFGNLFRPHTLVVFLVLLLFFGAKRLPELAKDFGETMRKAPRQRCEPLSFSEKLQVFAMVLLLLACLLWGDMLVQRL